MGLSNEERIQRVLNTIVSMRHELDPPDIRKWDDAHDSRFRAHIDAIGESLDQLTGLLIQQTDTSGAFWILGENSDGFRGLTMEYFRAETKDLGQAHVDAFMEEDSDEDLSLHRFARELGFGQHSRMLDLAAWWDLWGYIPSLLYGMNRYKDELFKDAFRREVNRLISLMQQFHRFLVGRRYQEEQVMLLKYKLYVDDKYKDETPWRERCKKLRAMTQEELEQEIRRREKEMWDSRKEFREKEKEKKEKPIDPVHGVVDMTIDGLVDDVQKLLRKAKVYGYYERSKVIRALELYDGNVEHAAELIQMFDEKKRLHERRYGHDNVKICKRCRFVVLDQRNKSGFCIECLPLERKRRSKKK